MYLRGKLPVYKDRVQRPGNALLLRAGKVSADDDELEQSKDRTYCPSAAQRKRTRRQEDDKGRKDGGRDSRKEKYADMKRNIDINKQIMRAQGARELCTLIETRVAEFNHVNV